MVRVSVCLRSTVGEKKDHKIQRQQWPNFEKTVNMVIWRLARYTQSIEYISLQSTGALIFVQKLFNDPLSIDHKRSRPTHSAYSI